ncbi:YuiA family protein [Chungangia koreensis]|uniref:YuiA family protein n=1 Tax=Chungangia koreensis TaxID=752657 RepID=A0ABV8X8S6_9LACT
MTMPSRGNYKLDCPYCKGKGYVQLRLGGSETCLSCKGAGKKA